LQSIVRGINPRELLVTVMSAQDLKNV
jgi:Ca2+-dependent lipid-binding protein